MVDRAEAIRRGQSKPSRKTNAMGEPFIGLIHRVFDSPAHCDLKPTSKNVLQIIMRQLTDKNNGHLQATYSFATRYGIGSEHTLQGAIAELIAHGLIYRTHSHGANGVWASYAVTFLPLTKETKGLFLGGYVHDAWKHYTPKQKKPTRKKCRLSPA